MSAHEEPTPPKTTTVKVEKKESKKPRAASKSQSRTTTKVNVPNPKKKSQQDNVSKARAASEDSHLDSIPTTNPEAPRHDGQWYWLMKAEPESRIVNGIDVKFSIDDLRDKDEPEGWDGRSSVLVSEEDHVGLHDYYRYPVIRRFVSMHGNPNSS